MPWTGFESIESRTHTFGKDLECLEKTHTYKGRTYKLNSEMLQTEFRTQIFLHERQ